MRKGRMHKPSEGMRRLGIVLGAFAATSWLTFIFIASDGFIKMNPTAWTALVLGMVVTFSLAVGATWGIDWVMAGFREDSRK